MPELSKDNASQIAIEFLKKQKGTDKIDVIMIEMKNGCWVVTGTTPIRFGEMVWPERFAVVVDSKGRVKSTEYGLL